MNSAVPHLQLEAGDVHVWWIDLTRVTESDSVLSAEERARAGRFRQSHDRRGWIAAHVALRQILSHHTGISPAALRLATGAQGKPALLDEPSLSFNLSHAGERAALAVSWQREVGIDLEPLAGDLPGRQNLKALMASACTPAEATWIASLPAADRRVAFLKLWTLKEAYLKGIGVGLMVEPRMVEVVTYAGTLVPLVISPSPIGMGEGVGGEGLRGDGLRMNEHPWILRLLNPGPAWVAALAVAGAQPAITEHHWPLDSRVL